MHCEVTGVDEYNQSLQTEWFSIWRTRKIVPNFVMDLSSAAQHSASFSSVDHCT